MKIKVSVTIDVDSKSFAECYGEDYSKEQNRFIRDDANHCVEQLLCRVMPLAPSALRVESQGRTCTLEPTSTVRPLTRRSS